MKKIKTLLIIFISFLNLNLNSYSKEINIYQKESFNNQFKSSIPINFKGVNIKDLYTSLTKNKELNTQTEYETKLDFEKRLVTQNKKYILNNLSKESLFCFIPEDYSSKKYVYDNTLELKYNSEEKELNVSINLENDQIKINDYNNILGTNKAQNSYGAKTIVTRMILEDFQIKIMNVEDFNLKKYILNNTLKTNISLDPIKAKIIKEKNKLNILLIGKLNKNTHSYNEDYSLATISNPSEAKLIKKIINLDIEEIWLFDKKTGEVLKKIIKNNSVKNENKIIEVDENKNKNNDKQEKNKRSPIKKDTNQTVEHKEKDN